MRIKTHYSPSPIPNRSCDWTAYDDDTYDGSIGQPLGYGKTERDAIDDLLEQMDCETCGGAGETVHRGYGGDPVNDYAKPCGACNGTGRPPA
jgi:DnaJ-class molecular chaperone